MKRCGHILLSAVIAMLCTRTIQGANKKQAFTIGPRTSAAIVDHLLSAPYEKEKFLFLVGICDDAKKSHTPPTYAQSLMMRIAWEDPDSIPDFIKAGVPVDQSPRESFITPLMVAAYWGNVDILKRLLKNGAKVTKENICGENVRDYALMENNPRDPCWIALKEHVTYKWGEKRARKFLDKPLRSLE